jgi:hypothetical protein
MAALPAAPGVQAQLHLAQITATHADEHNFTAAEARQYQEAAAEQDPQRRIALLDAFVAKYPDSSFMPHVLNLYYSAYMALKDYRHAFEYADRFLMLGAPLGLEARLQALYTRCKVFQNVFDPNARDADSELTKNRYDALEAARMMASLTKSADTKISNADFEASKRDLTAQMFAIAADDDIKLHNTAMAEDELKHVLENNPSDGWAEYTLGLLDLKDSPPQTAEGFWLMARAVPTRPDAAETIRKNLRNELMAYQHTDCEATAESEVNELIRRASASPQRPADFNVPDQLTPQQEQQCAPQAEAAGPAPSLYATKNAPPPAAETKTAPPPAPAVHKPQPPAAEAKPAPPPAAETKTAPPPAPAVHNTPPPAVEANNTRPPAAEAKPAPPPAAEARNPPPPAAPHRGIQPDEPARPTASDLSAGRYYALVIGIDDYQYAPKLKTAVGDAEAVANVLSQQYGFVAKLLTNATREDIIHALADYRRTLDENSNLLIYYAGHGVYDKEADKTYWLPADGEITDNSNWIMADEITTDIKVIPARHVLIISDSCYSGGITRSVDVDFTPQERTRYLEKMMAGKSRTLMASGGLEPVSDEGGGGHSVFAAALLRGLTRDKDPVFSAENLFETFIRVSVAGQSDQTPQYNVIRNSGHDSGDFVFIRSNPTDSSR